MMLDWLISFHRSFSGRPDAKLFASASRTHDGRTYRIMCSNTEINFRTNPSWLGSIGTRYGDIEYWSHLFDYGDGIDEEQMLESFKANVDGWFILSSRAIAAIKS